MLQNTAMKNMSDQIILKINFFQALDNVTKKNFETEMELKLSEERVKTLESQIRDLEDSEVRFSDIYFSLPFINEHRHFLQH